MSNLEGSYGTELEPIILLHELEDTQKTDEEVSLNSEKKLKNLPPTRTSSHVWQYYEKVADDKGIIKHIKCNFCDQKYSVNTSTGTLNDHFKRKHFKIQPGGAGSIEAAFNNSQICIKLQGENYEVILDNLVDWVIIEY